MNLPPPPFLSAARSALGEAHVLIDPDTVAGHCTDWTGRFRAPAVPVLRPGDLEQVVEVVAAAREHGVGLVPQGGNTGLVGGGVPLDGGVVVDLRRVAGVSDVDSRAGQLTAGAGCVVRDVQRAAEEAGWAYGVDWAARDSATIGGSVATDAGGLRFVRHGSTRRQLLGVEAVLGTGEVIDHLPLVEKDNTGLDLAALMCGSEGILGLVTRVRVRLVSARGPVACSLVGFESVQGAVEAAASLRREVADLEAVELMVRDGIELVCAAVGLPAPLPEPSAALLLVEVSARPDPSAVLAAALDSCVGIVATAVATDEVRRRALWRYREMHTDAIARLGPAHKLDVTLPGGALAGFVRSVPTLVARAVPDARTWLFGHAADGNVHVNVTGVDPGDESVDDVVLREVADLGGSISAEHGIGRAKRRWLHLARGSGDISAMAAVKRALDPDGVCNPGVLLPETI